MVRVLSSIYCAQGTETPRWRYINVSTCWGMYEHPSPSEVRLAVTQGLTVRQSPTICPCSWQRAHAHSGGKAHLKRWAIIGDTLRKGLAMMILLKSQHLPCNSQKYLFASVFSYSSCWIIPEHFTCSQILCCAYLSKSQRTPRFSHKYWYVNNLLLWVDNHWKSSLKWSPWLSISWLNELILMEMIDEQRFNK